MFTSSASSEVSTAKSTCHHIEAQKCALQADWEKLGIKAGKICEIAYCILDGICTGVFPAAINKPRDMQAACRALEQENSTNAPRSARVQIPRVVAATYELRNNRAIGHASSEISPNKMDGLFFHQSIKWIVSELIRICGRLNQSEATKLIEAINVRWSTAVWDDGRRKRLLLSGLSKQDELLAILYFSDFTTTLKDVRAWLEIENITNFKNRVVIPLHKKKFINFDKEIGNISLLPPGITYVEERYLTE
ncbi:hypothetical protein FLX27_16470 [Agrobacterium tumefaciens]|nr:hypothetical protein [Agrobacterium tumefaciens]TQN60375.1 hypothetical protein FLX27_16470 [Agrobacterium tumefaciens]